MGIDFALPGEPFVCKYSSDSGSQLGLLPQLYRLPRIQLGRIQQQVLPIDTARVSLTFVVGVYAILGSRILVSHSLDVKQVYSIMWRICRLKHVQTFILIHFVAKIGFQASEAVTGLKLVEKGFGKEDLALAVLIDFPFQLIFGYLAARWSKGDRALQPWVVAFFFRIGFALLSMAIVHGMPKAPIGAGYFFVVIASTVAGSFASTVQFVGISAFHTQIADPLIGGTYMTLLNTVSNLGGTWPRYFVLKAVDLFTISSCQPPSSSSLMKDPEIVQGDRWERVHVRPWEGSLLSSRWRMLHRTRRVLLDIDHLCRYRHGASCDIHHSGVSQVTSSATERMACQPQFQVTIRHLVLLTHALVYIL